MKREEIDFTGKRKSMGKPAQVHTESQGLLQLKEDIQDSVLGKFGGEK